MSIGVQAGFIASVQKGAIERRRAVYSVADFGAR